MFPRVQVARNLFPFLTLRLTEKQINTSTSDDDQVSYREYLPITGWLKAIETTLGNGRLGAGLEREGGTL